VYSGTIVLTSVSISNGTARRVPNPLAIASTRSYALGVAGTWAALSANGTTTVTGGTSVQISLNGTNPTRNVFTVRGADLARATTLRINAPAGSVVIINIDGAQDSMQNMSITITGTDRQRVVYNFYQAAQLTLKSVSVLGTIWAPAANITLMSGSVAGTILG